MSFRSHTRTHLFMIAYFIHPRCRFVYLQGTHSYKVMRLGVAFCLFMPFFFGLFCKLFKHFASKSFKTNKTRRNEILLLTFRQNETKRRGHPMREKKFCQRMHVTHGNTFGQSQMMTTFRNSFAKFAFWYKRGKKKFIEANFLCRIGMPECCHSLCSNVYCICPYIATPNYNLNNIWQMR